jgi:hypothetical protein
VRVNNRRKSSISMQQFISEFGENFSEHMKEKLMELESRSFCTRKEINYRVDLKHVEHIQYECACDTEGNPKSGQKEYAYGQFAVIEGILYFSESCLENVSVMESPVVRTIYNSLDSVGMITDKDINMKKIDDSNIDYVIDSILAVCPQVSQEYLNITQGMLSRVKNK